MKILMNNPQDRENLCLNKIEVRNRGEGVHNDHKALRKLYILLNEKLFIQSFTKYWKDWVSDKRIVDFNVTSVTLHLAQGLVIISLTSYFLTIPILNYKIHFTFYII